MYQGGPVNNYLRLYDYNRIIQSDNLNQILSNNDNIRLLAEQSTIEEVIGRLVQKYWVFGEFTNTLPYSPTTTYGANSRVELNYPEFNFSTIYSVGNCVSFGTDPNNSNFSQEFICIEAPASPWVAQSYVIGNQVIYTDGNYYQCIADATSSQPPPNATYWELITSQNPSNDSFWQLLGNEYDLFYIAPPYPVFNVYCNYEIGDCVYWNGKIYKCLQPSYWGGGANYGYGGWWYGQQPRTYAQLAWNLPNYFPGITSPVSPMTASQQQWGTGTVYNVIGVNPYNPSNPDNPTPPSAWSNLTTYSTGQFVIYNNLTWQSLTNSNLNNIPGADIVNWQSITWVLGDNRSQKIVECCVDISLYNIHSRISPRLIPEHRKERWENAKRWLDGIAEGVDTPINLMLLQPTQGTATRYGGNIKNVNTY